MNRSEFPSSCTDDDDALISHVLDVWLSKVREVFELESWLNA